MPIKGLISNEEDTMRKLSLLCYDLIYDCYANKLLLLL